MSRFHPSVSWQSSSASSNHASQKPSQSHSADLDQNKVVQCDFAPLIADSTQKKFDLQNVRADLQSPQTFYLPLHYEPNYRYPLIVWLHSDGFNENQVDHVIPHISTRNYLATGIRGTRAMDSVGHQFQWHASASAVDSAYEKVLCGIDEVFDRYSVHDQRIVLAGYRSGGTMAMRIALRAPNRFAGVISLGGKMPSGGRAYGDLKEIRERKLPMLWQWAIEADLYSEDALQNDISQAQLIHAKVDVRQYKDNDEMNTVALSDVNQWIMNRIVAGQPLSADESCETSEVGFSDN
ncbi:alpha/beta hydrolase [Planctomycetes bacterium K23_9]|uniref:Esterase n=1 Tax=Stieleria marina TaxID=1930275 RepID=A0A517P0R7_9BACT|nr:Putative esterase [Planctomycetes bacterium K23_9]